MRSFPKNLVPPITMDSHGFPSFQTNPQLYPPSFNISRATCVSLGLRRQGNAEGFTGKGNIWPTTKGYLYTYIYIYTYKYNIKHILGFMKTSWNKPIIPVKSGKGMSTSSTKSSPNYSKCCETWLRSIKCMGYAQSAKCCCKPPNSSPGKMSAYPEN